jgi:hypothetical protein
MLYFVIFKDKKEKEYKMFNNTIFNTEKEAEHFGKGSMRRHQEHKVVEYTKENYNKYWNNDKKIIK